MPYIIEPANRCILASPALKYLFPTNETLGATLTGWYRNAILYFRVYSNFLFNACIINVATGSKEQGMFAGLAIGSTVLLEAMFAGPVCGASMNPARSISPAIVTGHLEHLWSLHHSNGNRCSFCHSGMEILHHKNDQDKLALFSDIYANASFGKLFMNNKSQVPFYCLGDLVGYNIWQK